MDMGNIMHKVLESLIKEVNKEKLSLAELSEEAVSYTHLISIRL